MMWWPSRLKVLVCKTRDAGSIPAHISMITAQEYIESQLEKMKQPSSILDSVKNLPPEEQIEKILLSKKFRKYSASEEFIAYIRNAIKIQVEKNQPIQIVFVNGAYKLWRLEEAPEVDWAELFSIMYYTNWIKGICDVYEPGVHFDFFMDDLIVPKINTAPIEDVHSYIDSFTQLLGFVKQYQPSNLQMTLTTVGGQFDSEDAFDASLNKNLDELTASTPGGLVETNEKLDQMIDLNSNPTQEQLQDPLWKRKIWHIHTAYGKTKAEPGYHKREDKIIAFASPLPGGMTLSVGTCKTSIMKFWIGVGALQEKGESMIETILSWSALQDSSFDYQDVQIEGLGGKNFNRIRVK